MKAGRELDALMAEYVMGWNWGDTGKGLEGLMPPDKHSTFILTLTFDSSGLWGGMPHYSTNIADAWKVVEKMENTHRFSLHRTVKENGWQVIFWDIETDAHRSLVAETAPLAICLAALRCKGIDIDGNN